MKGEIIILRIINLFLLLLVPACVLFLMALTVLLFQGNTIRADRLIFFLAIIMVTGLLKIIKYRLTKKQASSQSGS
jgi:putative effector of murein hydrolase LrgA (UPF0299 family)